ncbi:MAG TPA: LptA/OstA family protein [Terriglobales bacterium]|nr:LptA/OstA family protein [Terriglobales bacterium]
MPISVPRLRRWFAAAAIALVMVVAGMYMYARWRLRDAFKNTPGKIGLEIQQTSQGFTISKSEEGRTLFTVRASRAVQFKQGGHAELHDVNITLYGRDSNRYDQIYGSEFDYDPRSGDVSARGEVQIDLQPNPAGAANPDQTPPMELKNPVHLKTSGLVFNQKTGNAYTRDRVEFSIPQASGSAVGVSYVAKRTELTLQSQLHVILNNEGAADISADRGVIGKDPRQLTLEKPVLKRVNSTVSADSATVFLRADNNVDHILASGHVQADVTGKSEFHGGADEADLLMNGPRNTLRTALLSGKVHMDSTSNQPMRTDMGRAVLEFGRKQRLDKVHAEQGVRLSQGGASGLLNASGQMTASQDLEIAAPAMDFFIAKGQHLDRAQTSGAAQITITQSTTHQRTVVTADEFQSKFGDRNQLISLHGSPAAKIVSSTPNQPDRISTSDALDVSFRAVGGIDAVVQQGNVAYVDGERKAWADRARYTPGDQMLSMSGSPRIEEGGMTTTAQTVRLNRTTGDAIAEGSVKSTYSELKSQPAGALLASADPIHVTARTMTAHRSPALATYTGTARLWQNANVIEAATIQFDHDKRSVLAQRDGQPVSTVLVQAGQDGKVTPVAITSSRLTYTDADRIVHFEGGVVAKGQDVTISAAQALAYLQPHEGDSPQASKSSQLDKIVAEGNVVVQEADRRAGGEKLVYTVSEDRFVLTGGPPSIFDAEHGKISGDSLTFYKRDDRVLVEGRSTSPTTTTTRVAR